MLEEEEAGILSVSAASAEVYVCENECGYEGTFLNCSKHEAICQHTSKKMKTMKIKNIKKIKKIKKMKMKMKKILTGSVFLTGSTILPQCMGEYVRVRSVYVAGMGFENKNEYEAAGKE